MLPSRPTLRMGLPTNPRSYTPTTTQSDNAEPRYVRGQRSIASISSPSPRLRSPPVHSTQERPSITSRTHKSSDSTSTASSSGSLFFDKVKSDNGYFSSCTSFEDDEQSPKVSGLRAARDRAVGSPHESPIDESNPLSGDGHTIWSRVAIAASSLSVNVSKAWATNVATFSGEETPPGQESRLTRAMKAYHLEKARDSSDLPPWLFDEHERRPGYSRRSERADIIEVEEQARPRGLRDVYAASVSTPPPQLVERRYKAEGAAPSKAANRLKALREAKRGGSSNSMQVYDVGGNVDDNIDNHDISSSADQKRPRVGLPSGPGARSRRV